MSILSVVQDVCAVVGITTPTSVFSGITDNRTMQEMVALANEMSQRIAYDTRDWQRLRSVATHTGDGRWEPPLPDPLSVYVGTTAFTLPANYKRMLLTSNVWKTNSGQAPLLFVSDTDDWLNRRANNTVDGFGEWTILGGQIHVYPILPAGHTVYYTYLDKHCIELRAANGAIDGYADRYLNDGDVFLLDERVLKLGMIWQWKANKGNPYAEDMGTYSDALVNIMGKDAPAPIIIGRGGVGHHTGGGNAAWLS